MDNNLNHLDDSFLIDVRKTMRNYKILAISSVCFGLLAIVLTSIITTSKTKKLIGTIRFIDKQGQVYTSSEIDKDRATDLQIRGFLLHFIQLSYQYDFNNIQSNLQRALKLADGTFKLYLQNHNADGLYQSISVLKRVARIDDNDVMNHIEVNGNSFRVSFTQTVSNDSGEPSRFSVSISGKIAFVTPDGVDNPNGFLITNFIESYAK